MNTWPPEGLPLADAFVRLLPDIWKSQWDNPPVLDSEFRVLLLERSDLTLWGRPKDPYANLVDLGTAARLIVSFTWELSIAHDVNGERIYDMHVRQKSVKQETDPCSTGVSGHPAEQPPIVIPRGAGAKSKYNSEFVINAAWAYVAEEGLPSSFEALCNGLRAKHEDKVPQISQCKVLLAQTWTSIQQAYDRR